MTKQKKMTLQQESKAKKSCIKFQMKRKNMSKKQAVSHCNKYIKYLKKLKHKGRIK